MDKGSGSSLLLALVFAGGNMVVWPYHDARSDSVRPAAGLRQCAA